jgi:uncharacterized protein (DUF433 family)
MGRVPCIRGMRIPVATVVGLIADGLSTADVLRELPYLDAEDVKAVLQYVSRSANESEFELVLGSEGIPCESR